MIGFPPLTKGVMVLSLALVMAGTAQSESTSCTKFKKCGGCDISISLSLQIVCVHYMFLFKAGDKR